MTFGSWGKALRGLPGWLCGILIAMGVGHEVNRGQRSVFIKLHLGSYIVIILNT